MDKDLDTLLKTPLLRAPDDFTQQVMARLDRLPLPRRAHWLIRLRGLAPVKNGLLGAAQLTVFMLGIWAAASAT